MPKFKCQLHIKGIQNKAKLILDPETKHYTLYITVDGAIWVPMVTEMLIGNKQKWEQCEEIIGQENFILLVNNIKNQLLRHLSEIKRLYGN
jgi:hypothetical protein